MFMLRFFVANRTLEFWLDTALESYVTIQTVRSGIWISTLFAHECSAAAGGAARAAGVTGTAVTAAHIAHAAVVVYRCIEINAGRHEWYRRCNCCGSGSRNSRWHNDLAQTCRWCQQTQIARLIVIIRIICIGRRWWFVFQHIFTSYRKI